jgi:hypothetical protein
VNRTKHFFYKMTDFRGTKCYFSPYSFLFSLNPFLQTMKNSCIVLLFCLFADANFAQPCLRVLEEVMAAPNQCPINPNTLKNANANIIPLQFGNPREGLEGSDSARYKAFWIFGDGNFIEFPDRHKAADEATLSYNYQYQRSGTYRVVTNLVEKKSNKQPPGDKERRIRVDIPVDEEEIKIEEERQQERALKQAAAPPPPGTPFTRRLTGDNRADLLASQDVRLGGYSTAIAASASLPSPNAPGVAILFYNSVRTRDGALFAINPLLSPALVAQANYTPENSHYNTSDLSRIPLAVRGYGSALIQPMTVINDFVAPAVSEFRFFPILKTDVNPPDPTTDLGKTGMGETQFLLLTIEGLRLDTQQTVGAILTPIQIAPTTLGAAQRQIILNLLSLYAPGVRSAIIDTVSLRLSTGGYVTGAAYMQRDIVAVIDPTELVIKSICPTKTDNEYLVDARMTVCNEGNFEETQIGVDIFQQPVMLVRELTVTSNLSDLVNLSTTINNDTVLSFDYHKGLLGAYENPAKEYVPSCFDMTFQFKTNWVGVKMLRNGGALTAKVHFKSALIKPIQDFPNDSLSQSAVTEKYGYNCGGGVPGGKGSGNSLWLWVILAALGLVFWWLWRQQQEEN